MGNLYEQTQTIQYVRDLVLLENDEESKNGETLRKKLSAYPKYAGPIDDDAQKIIPRKSSKKRSKEIDDLLNKAVAEKINSTK